MDALVAILAVVCGLAFPLAAGAVLLGWLVPLIMGITRTRRGRGGGGLIVAGGAWGLVAVGIVTWLVYTFATLSNRFTPQAFDPQEYAGETGQIVIAWQGPCELTLYPESGGGVLLLSTENGQFTAPAGRHRLASWELQATDDSDREWSVTGRPGYDWPEQKRTVSVDSTTAARIDVQLPLRASINADVGGDDISMGFSLSDGAGGQYAISSRGRDDPPKFEMVDDSGRVVLTGDFAYG